MVILIAFLAVVLLGCEESVTENDGLLNCDIVGNYADRKIAEEFATRHFASFFFRVFVVEETIYNKETNEYEVFVISEYDEIRGSITLYISEGGAIQIRDTKNLIFNQQNAHTDGE
jgi:hypothetical protein